MAELLSRHVPLARALGIEADWRLLQGTPEFFAVTKALHNGLQGGEGSLSEADKAVYLRDAPLRRAFGAAAREHVRRGYLLPRLLRDELRLIKDVLG